MTSLRFGDVVFVKCYITGWRTWRRWCVSFLIRFMSTSSGEGPTFANHVAMVLRVEGNSILLVEALGKRGFVQTLLAERYGDTRRFEVRVARHQKLVSMNATLMLRRIAHLRDKKYGTFKILAHATDYALTQLWHSMGGPGECKWFRKLCRNGDYPICSWAVADIYAAGGLPFRTSTPEAQPDDLYDECNTSPVWDWVTTEVV